MPPQAAPDPRSQPLRGCTPTKADSCILRGNFSTPLPTVEMTM